MPNNASRTGEKFVVVRHPSSQGAIVKKLGNDPLIPDELHSHPDLIFQSVADVSALTDKSIDWQAVRDLEGTELGVLLEEHWELISDAKER